MPSRFHPVIGPATVCSLITGALTVLFVLNSGAWPISVVIGLAVGGLGLIVSTRKGSHNQNIQRLRWTMTLISVIVCVSSYGIAGYVAMSNETSGLTTISLFVLGPIMLPFYFGAAQLLSLILIPDKLA